uniref:Triple gene block 1 n=1 Tax=Ligustrum virus A TaxID=1899566 RepID=A0A7S9PRC1_9VIRU|nr:triple gene block 1 [Ligustrum virus A]
MDILVKYLSDFGFVRLSNSIRPPVVIHCVPGAGKTTLIRSILKADTRFIAFTCGIPDQPNLEGNWIRALPEELPKDKFVLVDEYTLGDQALNVFALFGDPLQSNQQVTLRADFICNFSNRFGSSTAKFLRSLGYNIEAEGTDTIEVCDIFSKDPEGQVVYFEREVGELLCAHGVDAKTAIEIQGQTFKCVTFVTAENQPLVDPIASFQCLTRHRQKLLILCPDASYSTPR